MIRLNDIIVQARNLYYKERLCTVDLHVLISLDQLLLIMKILFTFVIKQAALMGRSTLLSLPIWLVFLSSGQMRGSRPSVDRLNRNSSKVVEPLSLHPKVVGSSLTAATGAGERRSVYKLATSKVKKFNRS
jgi:hypothetical protein